MNVETKKDLTDTFTHCESSERMTPERIRECRETLGLSKQEFATKLGISLATVYRWENGETKPLNPTTQFIEQMVKSKRKGAA